MINNIAGQLGITGSSIVDLTLLEAYDIIDNGFKSSRDSVKPPNELFRVLYTSTCPTRASCDKTHEQGRHTASYRI